MIKLAAQAVPVRSNPSTHALPEVGDNSVVNILMSVDFPAPFGPITPKISPRRTDTLT
jgi:hypothetical protein